LGAKTGIAIGSSGAVHISYGDIDKVTGAISLKYATNASGAWEISVIQGQAGYANSIAVDLADRVHIAYTGSQFSSSGGVWYATNASGTWTATHFYFGANEAIRPVSLGVDAAGVVHIAFATGSGICAIAYTNNAAGTWPISYINDSAQCGVSLALDSAGRPHVAYMDWGDLMYATNVSGAWVSSVIDHMDWVGGADVSIAVGPGDKLHVSYEDQNADLKYATNVSGAWVAQFLDAGGEFGKDMSIKVDPAGKAHISYDYPSNHTLKYVTSR
jgi:hypothetical protein